jgi:hypothetical protein
MESNVAVQIARQTGQCTVSVYPVIAYCGVSSQISIHGTTHCYFIQVLLEQFIALNRRVTMIGHAFLAPANQLVCNSA